MPAALVIAMAGIVVVLFALRVLVPALPVRGAAVPVRRIEVAAVLLATAGLVLHCGAMFDRPVVLAFPRTGGYVNAVNSMSAASIALFVLPALVLAAALRRQHPAAVTALTLSLTAVGITMYDHGPVTVHLAAIFTSGVTLALITTLLVPLPSRAHRARKGEAGPAR